MKMIMTTLGELPEHDLERTTIFTDGPREYTVVVEYRYKGELVHRSPWVNLKESPAMAMDVLGKITGG